MICGTDYICPSNLKQLCLTVEAIVETAEVKLQLHVATDRCKSSSMSRLHSHTSSKLAHLLFVHYPFHKENKLD